MLGTSPRTGELVAAGTATRRRVGLPARRRLRTGRYTLRVRAHGHTTVRRIALA